MSDRALYPYYEETATPTFPGEMPTPQPVGFNDPGISDLKANADHSHAPSNLSGTGVQERLFRAVGPYWGPGVVGGSYQRINALGVCPLEKQFGGTVLRYTFGASGWATVNAGSIGVVVSPTDSTGDGILVTNFFFNQVGVHAAWTGAIDVTNRPAAQYNSCVFLWSAGPAFTFNNDGNDLFWLKIAEVWP